MIILSVTGPSVVEALAQMRASRRDADLIELRLDRIAHGRKIGELIRAARRPVIATCRPRWEGGAFEGSERERVRVLETASAQGARYLDLELAAWHSLMRTLRESAPPRGTIASLHHFGRRAPSARQVFGRLRAVGADVVKYAFRAESIASIALVQDFLTLAKGEGQRAIAIGMGEHGETSRVLYRKLGGWATYGRAASGEAAAAGQLSVAELRRLYRSHRQNSRTRVFGVVGNPVAQSKGVQLHNRLLRGMNAVYCRLLVNDLAQFMDRVAPMTSGFSVTIPHKEAMLRFIQACDDRAARAGAVNTVLRRGGTFWGTNCDGIGALRAIERVAPVRGKVLLILGSGGTARAIASEAHRRGAEVIIAGRSMNRARALARELDLRAVPMEEAGEMDFHILANATPVGMAPNVKATPIKAHHLRNKVVFDAVYNPAETKLLREARRLGARTVSGTEMFLNQAAIQFELFTGCRADRTVMRRTLKHALAQQSSSDTL